MTTQILAAKAGELTAEMEFVAQREELDVELIRSEVAANTPYDEFVQKIITADGSNKENPAASYYKILRNPEDTMENTTHLFLATRFNCRSTENDSADLAF